MNSSHKPENTARRKLLKGGAIFIAGAASGGAVLNYFLKGNIETKKESISVERNTRNKKYYTSGDVIDTGTERIKIEGWELVPDVRHHAPNKRNRNIETDFLLIPHNIGFNLHRGSYSPTPGLVGPTKILVFPHYRDGVAYLRFTERQDGEITNEGTCEIRVKYYTQRSSKSKLANVCSEVPLEDSTFDRISGLHGVFTKFASEPTVFIRRERKHGYGAYNPDAIHLPSRIFINPKHQNEGIIVLFHELAHGLIYEVTVADKQTANMAMYRAYEHLVKRSGVEIASVKSLLLFGHSQKRRENPYFSIFDESTYINVNGIQRNPTLNYRELFATTLTVFRFFPDQFIERFEGFSLRHKSALVQVGRAVFECLDFLNDDPKELARLLPKHARLKKALGI